MGSLIRAFFKNSGVVALPGYSIFDTPWAGFKVSSQARNVTQGSAYLSGGIGGNTSGQGNYITTDQYLATGTFKIAMIFDRDTGDGIVTFTFTGAGGASVGTIDEYGVFTSNVYAEITGIAVTAGVKQFTTQTNTKNASSSNYNQIQNTIAIVRTGA